MRGLLKNKRGAVAVGVMTILVVVLYVYLLFALKINSSNLKEEFEDVYVSGRVYGVVEGLESSVHLVLFNSFLKSYDETLSENSGKIKSANLSAIFENKIKEDISDVAKKVLGAGNDKNSLFVKTLYYPREIVFDGEKVVLTIHPEILEEDYKLAGRNFSTKYEYDLKNEMGFDVFNLSSFDRISNVYEDCSGIKQSSGEIEGCLKDNFLEYNVTFLKSEIHENEKTQTLTFELESKKGFFFDGAEKNISFELQFVVDWINAGGPIIVS